MFFDTQFQVAGMGFETTAFSSEKLGVDDQGGAKSGALSGDSSQGGALLAPSDPDLMAVIDAWPGLPETVRQSILAMMPATKRGNSQGATQ
jgi:hypothetical protein